MAVLPLVMTNQGLQPAAPADLRASLIALVSAIVPDYTANLPGSLIEDISSTDTYALVESDSFLVDLVNSVTPYGANAFLLNELGILYGVDHQPITNTAVYVVFNGPPGYIIAQGFVVGDGTYQYICQSGGICGIDGNTLPIYALATVPGAWEVMPNTVVQMLTSVPVNIPLTVTNSVAGIPSISGEPISIFRERCFTAGLAASTGMARYLKTLVGNIPGVQNRLISVQTQTVEEDPVSIAALNRAGIGADKYVIIVGGGDPFQVAYAIWQADFYTPGLSGAEIQIANISNTNPAEITTVNNHNLVDGDVETITGAVGMPQVNNIPFTITTASTYRPSDPLRLKRFTIPVDGTHFGSYAYGGIVTPNPINANITVADYPDTFLIPFVIPFQETVEIEVVWRTDTPNFVPPDAVAQLAVPAIVDYINSLPAGTSPINLNVLNKVFIDSVVTVLLGEYIIDLTWAISIDGFGVIPAAGTQVIFGDPFSYFYTQNGNVSVRSTI